MVLDEGVLEYLRKKIRDIMNEQADHIATGGASDWADYRYNIGLIEGLAKAERELLDLQERLEKQD
ncbi:hypothetical protein UFOVP1302_26 [uncultured Caudovirales phage]|uniref:Uncharacterized protein n=1 Tax=uncultured Caudovirales phage TaxID=2100421 RepID=A0A6J5PCA9_9CAUD|nr:hypothetical protein UFOVP895_29 [uncultured Caudovirales phage]CAB4181698.1 hypothetical protein UFOVP1070_58 [uncultured Caudovirales phage]CAB4195670.1 hypothetical protein UFOVP1302_26 [uncultured Caudovirales phage]CAB4211646.1 hypothetical protein UFOVP1416_6 [uncultured Caudovirales phage]